jgi:hypothetical protein
MRPVSPAMQTAEAHPVPSSSFLQCSDCPYEDSDPCIITCAAGRHHYCSEHMDALAKYQVGVQKSAFLRAECQFRCPHDDSILDMQKVIAAVSKVTWGQIDTALQEQAVIDTQKSLMSLAPAAKVSPHDAAMEQIRYRAQPRCKSCSALLTDFEACSALTCGVIKSGHRESGCGARICAWCLKIMQEGELHHEHVTKCRRNPDPGSVYPPNPHPETWNHSMALLTRERIFQFIETQRGEAFRIDLYKATRDEFPSFGLTEEWLTLRHRWMEIMIDCNAGDEDVEPLDNCRNVLLEMGYKDDDLLMRAIIFCKADVAQITYALRAEEARSE